MSKKIFILILITAGLGGGAGLLYLNHQTKSILLEEASTTLSIEGRVFNIEIADTTPTRTRGLSGKANLSENEGMLFVFTTTGHHHFWMKEMNFPIDIIWLDEDKKIVDITHSLHPETYPETYTSITPAKYVLEIKAGLSEQYKFKIGTQVKF